MKLKKLGHTGTTKRMERMTNKRNRRIDHYLHTVSHRVVNLPGKEGIGVLCLGKNPTRQKPVSLTVTRYQFARAAMRPGTRLAENGREINADIDGAYNIIRKVAPDTLQQAEGVEDGLPVAVHLVRVVIPRTKPKQASDH